MNGPTEGKLSLAPTSAQSKKFIQPQIPPLPEPPETAEQLFRSLALSVAAVVMQTDPAGKKPPRKQEYGLPWCGFQSWRDARGRLAHFEKVTKHKIEWAPFNDSTTNDGPMSLNAYPGRAFIERVTNEGDANLERKALSHTGPMPSSPTDAVALWFGLDANSLAIGLTNEDARDLARATVSVVGYVGDPKDSNDSIFDARDFGIGLTAAEMPGTILSLNRGNKKSKLYLTGKHGQGASSTYQYSDLTLIASRKIGAAKVAFTLVEATWEMQDGVLPKTPTYRYLTLDGQIPEVAVSETEFPTGTLVRHIGYSAADLFNPFGENSLYGLLMRSLAQPLFPVWLEMFSLRPAKALGYPTAPGYRRYGRLIRGTVNALERAWDSTLKGKAPDMDTGDENDPLTGEEADGTSTETDTTLDEIKPKILHRASEFYELPTWDYGGRTGVAPIGSVKINYWVADPAGRASNDVLRNWVDPNKTILLTLDGQTHAEEARGIVTSQQGAKLWAVGRYTVVQIDCNGLDVRAKYAMFTSTREHAKETPIKKMIVEEVVRRLILDDKMAELNVHLAAADIKQPENASDTIASLIKRYLKAAGVNFDQLTKKLTKWTEVEEQQEVSAAKKTLPPIEAVEPPTFVRWRFKPGATVSLYPGQRYSFVFETDAAPSYWNPADQTASKIKVLGHTVRYNGSGEMRGGRVRCHFECPVGAPIGAKGYIQVQLDFAVGEAKMHRLQVEVIAKPTPKYKKPGDKTDDKEPDDKGSDTKEITVKVKKKDFTEVQIPVMNPIPVKRENPLWNSLGWPHDPHRVGFSIRSVGGKVQLYYNAEFPPFLDLRNRMSKKSLHEEFVRRYGIKLVLHTIFTLNYDFVDEDDFQEEQRRRVRDLLCATAESLALATKSELEIESKLKSDDPSPLDTVVATEPQSVTA